MKIEKGDVAVITGAASGFGLCLAQRAAELGMRVVMSDIQEGALAEAVARVRSAGAEAIGVPCDVSSCDEVDALSRAAVEAFGSVNLVCANAGVGAGGLVWENSREDWAWVLGVNLFGVVNCIRSFVPTMLASERAQASYRGHVMATASMAGFMSSPLLGLYNTSKQAVVSLTETLHHDLKLVQSAIGVSVLCPYYSKTAIARSARNRPDELAGEHTPSQSLSDWLVSRFVDASQMTPEQVADRAFEGIAEGRFYVFPDPGMLTLPAFSGSHS